MLRTDLAIEAKEMYEENAQEITEIQGVKASTEDKGDISITTVEILNENGCNALNKPVGKYITIEIEKFRKSLGEYNKEAAQCIKEQILKLIDVKDDFSVLVAGLGNQEITSDAIGPCAVDYLIVTKHLLEMTKNRFKNLFGSVSAVKTGVMAQTGIESSEIIKGVAKVAKPDAIIVIDALVSRQTKRVASTIQITNTGISPGSGVGNVRREINKNTLDVPVIAIGVPMVVDAATIAYDTIRMLSENPDSDVNVAEDKAFEVIKDTVNKNIGGMMVAPKEADELTLKLAKIVAYGINLAFHNVEYDEIDSYIE